MKKSKINSTPRLIRGMLGVLMASLLMVSACGQKGPLFLPDDQLVSDGSEEENKEEKKVEGTD